MPSDKVKQLLGKFSLATIKAAMAERPEVMQASGWTYDEDNNLVQGDPNEPGATQLRNTLAEISTMPLLDIATAFGGEALLSIPKVRRAIGSIRAAKIINGAAKKSGATTLSLDSPIVRGIVGRGYSFPDNYPTTLDIKANLYPEAFVHRSTEDLSFLRDVQEGAVWGSNRGVYKPTAMREYNFVGVPELGHGAEAYVYENPLNPKEVLKQIDDSVILTTTGNGYTTPEEAISFGEQFAAQRNSKPYNLRLNVAGYTDNGFGRYSPVLSQKKVMPADKAASVSGLDLQRFQTRIGEGYLVPYKIDVPNNIIYENDLMPFYYNGNYHSAGHPMYGKDFKAANVGLLENGDLMGIDLNARGGRLHRLADRIRQVGYYRDGGKIHIDPSKKGTFTAAASRHGKSVQAFASQVLANKENYSPAMVKKANFARNAAKWKHADGGKLSKLADRINRTSNADFVRRLLNEKRKTLKNADGTVSTHELGYVTEGDMAVVFPNIQSVGDSLMRFPYPQSYERAVERGDTIHMSIPDAKLFTENYKTVYPGFNKYQNGGDVLYGVNEYHDEIDYPIDDYRVDTAEAPTAWYDTLTLPQVQTVRQEKYPNALPIDNHYEFAISDIKRRLIEQENEHRKGWNPLTRRWRSHKSAEGGEDTIGYGIKLVKGSPWAETAMKQGYLTNDQVMTALDQMSRWYYGEAEKVYNKKFGEGAWDLLNGKERSFLTDYQYNVKNGGLKNFPKLMQAIHDGDIAGIKKESSRTYTGEDGKKHPLEKRNAAMIADADSIAVYYPHGYYLR